MYKVMVDDSFHSEIGQSCSLRPPFTGMHLATQAGVRNCHSAQFVENN